jgi:seryl-tRNA synthetase
MLDIRLIRENPDAVKDRLKQRGGDVWTLIDEVLACDETRRSAETAKQLLQSERNRVSKEIGMAKKAGQDTSAIETEMRAMGTQIAELDEKSSIATARQDELLLSIPNLPHAACPVGADADANPEVRVWGQKPNVPEAKDHITLGKALNLFDFELGTKIAGSAFPLYRGKGAKLQRALIQFLLELHTNEHGYEEILPPYLANRESLFGTGQLPKFADQQYHCPEDDLFLIPTAEVPVTNIHRDDIIEANQLPVKYTAYTPCFRREAGAAGVGTRGLIRMHQFDKVELVKVTHPDQSFAELETLTAEAEKVLQLLGLHYRVIELCTGDLGFSSTKTYDIEVWAPGQGAYLEVSSCSNFGDYQARRLKCRYRDPETKKPVLAHTLNGSGTALARLYVSLLETHQQPDGSIHIPIPLQPYFGAKEIR